ncbi:MAG: PLP-dependent aminotransferase family protein [Dehalococcoidia bacterium]|jgi:2-aminoadipate transaminase|nr:PLP-dependent aminotransferase family protein [Dehalococcoidia bacterium]
MTDQHESDGLVTEVRDLWQGRDVLNFANEAVKAMSAGTATDWGLAAAIESPIPPVTLGGGIPDPATLPREDLSEAAARALGVEDDGPLRYGGAMGLERLRAQLAERYTRDRGLPVDASHFILENGSAGALDAVCAALLDAGDVVITEAPTFSGTLRTFRGKGAEIVSVGMDNDGMRTDEVGELADRLAAEGKTIKFIYTISNFHNPMGTTMSLSRRQELLRIAARHSAFVLDDDAYGEIHFGEAPPPALSALAGGYGVITVGTFSKIIATGLRVGWVHARPEIIEVVARMRFDMGNSAMLHHTLAEYIDGGRLDDHLEEMRLLYAEKMDILASALTEFAEPYLTFTRPKGGFFLWLKLQKGLTAEAVQRAAVQEGVIFPIGRAFFPEQKESDGEHIRLAYSWTSKDDLREGAERLARACARAAEGE